MASSRRAVPRPPDAIQRPLRARAAVWVPFTPTVQSRARSAPQRTCFAYCASARLASNTVSVRSLPCGSPHARALRPPAPPAHVARTYRAKAPREERRRAPRRGARARGAGPERVVAVRAPFRARTSPSAAPPASPPAAGGSVARFIPANMSIPAGQGNRRAVWRARGLLS